jgi:hypothetical protein
MVDGFGVTLATAHAIARVVYKMLKYKVEYAPLSAAIPNLKLVTAERVRFQALLP